MADTTPTQNTESRQLALHERVLHALDVATNALSMRQEIFRRTMDPRRNILSECGYPEIGRRDCQLYREIYRTEGIAKRVVDIIPKSAFGVQATVYEDEESEIVTPFEEVWDGLGRNLMGESSYKDERGSPLQDYLKRWTIASRLGRYAVLLVGIDDGKPLSEPAEMQSRRKIVKPQRQKKVPDPLQTQPFPTGQGPKIDENGKPLPEDKGKMQEMQAAKSAKEKAFQKLSGKGVGKGAPRGAQESGAGNEPATSANSSKKPTRGVPSLNADHGRNGVSNYSPEAFGSIRPHGGGVFSNFPQNPPSYAPMGGAAKDAELDKMIQGEIQDDGLDEELGTKRRLTYLRVFTEDLAQVTQFVSDEDDPRFGKPEKYLLTFNDPQQGSAGLGQSTNTREVHWTRVLHLCDEKGCNEVFGIPTLEPVLHFIVNLQKIYGADGEAFWKGCIGLLALSTHPELGGDVSIDRQALKDDMEKLYAGLQRYISLQAMSATTIAPAVTDPSSHVNCQLQGIAITLGIPQRKLMGSEQGELASGQDDGDWNDVLGEYRDNHLTPNVYVQFADRLISLGCLPEPDQGFSVSWPDGVSSSPQEKAQTAATKIQAIAAYVSGQLETVIAPMDFWTKIMELDEEEAAAIVATSMQLKEQREVEEAVKQQEAIDAGLAPDPTDPDQVLAHGMANGAKPNPFEGKDDPPGAGGKKPGSNPFAKGPGQGKPSGVAGRGKPPFA